MMTGHGREWALFKHTAHHFLNGCETYVFISLLISSFISASRYLLNPRGRMNYGTMRIGKAKLQDVKTLPLSS